MSNFAIHSFGGPQKISELCVTFGKTYKFKVKVKCQFQWAQVIGHATKVKVRDVRWSFFPLLTHASSGEFRHTDGVIMEVSQP